uniref:Uncharacterized protein n=1 Tax=Acrobeloides nanus TaxID=290746 RepID=A0A914CYJ4_9BILA
YFDDFGRFKHCVQFSDGFAYASGIAVNSHNELMVCDRKRSECKVYKLSGKPASEQRSGGSSSGYSGGAPRGGGGGRGNRGGGGSRPYRR